MPVLTLTGETLKQVSKGDIVEPAPSYEPATPPATPVTAVDYVLVGGRGIVDPSAFVGVLTSNSDSIGVTVSYIIPQT